MTRSSMQKIRVNKNSCNLIRDQGKVAENEANMQKSVAFLYIGDELVKSEIKNTLPFQIALPKMRYLSINLTKQGQLAGSVSGACDSWAQGCEFEPHVGCGAYLKNKKNKNKNLTKYIPNLFEENHRN